MCFQCIDGLGALRGTSARRPQAPETTSRAARCVRPSGAPSPIALALLGPRPRARPHPTASPPLRQGCASPQLHRPLARGTTRHPEPGATSRTPAEASVRTSFSFPTTIEFGAGALASLPDHVRARGSRAFVVTDPGVRGLPIFDRVMAVLADAGIVATSTDAISPNPLAGECEAGGRALRASGADVVIGLGGGSALDAAKGVALMATHEGRIVDYDDAKGGWKLIRADVPPVICIPTTAGTGSEVGRSTVVIDEDTHTKVVVFSPFLMPKVAIVDPELMVGMPAWLTAATGFDALTHNLEAFVAKGFHPMADGIALEGIAQVHTHLVTACRKPADLTARGGMAMAAMMGATAFQKGLGAAHSLAHPLGSLAGVHHGLANAVVLPYVVAFNREAAAERYALVERRLGLSEGLMEWLLALRRDIGIPHTLGEAGVSRALLEALSDQAIADGCHGSNPRPCSRDDLRNLYVAAFDGNL
ncbi:MAG: iron-containing alcohol dehydrogenase [Deltaproteobacteria bacterium]|nr:iron-containing alcohol dehydrogenase [Deltaproteobacteria bacterium]